MKKHCLAAVVLLMIVSGLNAQPLNMLFYGTSTFHPAQDDYAAYSLVGGIVSKYDADNGIATVNIGRVKEGKNMIATDTRKNRRLFMLADKDANGQIAVRGFAVMDSNGKWVRLGDPFRAKGDDSFGCPAGWDFRIICYTHPVYNVQVCYTRCTPTEITIQLPGGGL